MADSAISTKDIDVIRKDNTDGIKTKIAKSLHMEFDLARTSVDEKKDDDAEMVQMLVAAGVI